MQRWRPFPRPKGQRQRRRPSRGRRPGRPSSSFSAARAPGAVSNLLLVGGQSGETGCVRVWCCCVRAPVFLWDGVKKEKSVTWLATLPSFVTALPFLRPDHARPHCSHNVAGGDRVGSISVPARPPYSRRHSSRIAAPGNARVVFVHARRRPRRRCLRRVFLRPRLGRAWPHRGPGTRGSGRGGACW